MTGMTSTIYVTRGMSRYVGGSIIEVNGKDISTATYKVALSQSATTPPAIGEWVDPDTSTAGTTTAERDLSKLVDADTTPGTYYLWGRITDNPEVEPLILQGPIVVA